MRYLWDVQVALLSGLLDTKGRGERTGRGLEAGVGAQGLRDEVV